MSEDPTRCRLVDLSHAVEHAMVTPRGYPAPLICDYLSREASRAGYAEGTEPARYRVGMHRVGNPGCNNTKSAFADCTSGIAAARGRS